LSAVCRDLAGASTMDDLLTPLTLIDPAPSKGLTHA